MIPDVIAQLVGASPDELNQPVDLLVEPCLHLLQLVRSRGLWVVCMPHYRRMREGAKSGRVEEAGSGGSRTRKGLGWLMLPMLRLELWLIMVVTSSHSIFLKMALGEGFPEWLISHESLKIRRGLSESRLT